MAAQLSVQISGPAFVYGLGAELQSLNVLAAEIAATDIPVLLTGESGTGKDVYARLIHRLSGGDETSFVRISCGVMDPGEMLSEIRGAFQAAAEDVENCPKTVFLDGIHELDAVCQRVLLSLLPEGGERKSVARNFPRIISATPCNLEKEVEAGRFRLELYFRINGVILRLPALRERKEDIPYLLECFIMKHGIESGKVAPEISREGRKLLFSYDWPGNIRELENVARRIVAIGDAELALADVRVAQSQPVMASDATVPSLKVAAKAAVRRTERELILKALEQTHWNRKRAASHLHISYKSLLGKLKQIGAETPIPMPRKSEETT
jgi:DNA-binding NtrC family response regulator